MGAEGPLRAKDPVRIFLMSFTCPRARGELQEGGAGALQRRTQEHPAGFFSRAVEASAAPRALPHSPRDGAYTSWKRGLRRTGLASSRNSGRPGASPRPAVDLPTASKVEIEPLGEVSVAGPAGAGRPGGYRGLAPGGITDEPGSPWLMDRAQLKQTNKQNKKPALAGPGGRG